MNTGRLTKHLGNILSDKYLVCNDVIDLTETEIEVKKRQQV